MIAKFTNFSCVFFVIYINFVFTSSDNTSAISNKNEINHDFLQLEVARNSTNNIERNNEKDVLSVHVNEGGDLIKFSKMDNITPSISDKQQSIVDPVNDYVQIKKNYKQKSTIQARKGVYSSAEALEVIPNAMKVNVSKVLKNSSSDFNQNNQTSTAKKNHKPLVTNVGDEDPSIIPDLPPLAASHEDASVIISGASKITNTELLGSKNGSFQPEAAQNKNVQNYKNTNSSHKSLENVNNENVSVFKKYMDPLSKSHPSYIIPIVITVFAVPLFAILGLTAVRRAREAWKNRHYRRMDFLIDGMYND